MGRKKKETVELRFYELPQNEYVLALLGERWLCDYGQGSPGMHFHNLMEIGYCRKGAGVLVLDDKELPYEPAMLSVIPANYPHLTVSSTEKGQSFWEYLFLDPKMLLDELYPYDAVRRRELLEKISCRANLFYEREIPELMQIVDMIMEEMRKKRAYHTAYTRGLLFSLTACLLRVHDQAGVSKGSFAGGDMDVSRISAALDHAGACYMQPIRVEDLAKLCHMSETHFRRVFEACMNMQPMDYINFVRIQRACEMMKRSDEPMEIIAQKAGFATVSTFNRNFKKYLNTSPYQWKIHPENYECKLLEYKISAKKGW